jgi:hypothetical protein
MPQDPITRRETLLAASTLAATVAFGTAAAPVGANAQAAASTVDTRIGKIDLLMGLPANAEVERRIYDEMDFQRACQGYIWALPIVSMNEWKRAHETVLGAKPGELVLYDSYKDKLGILTANFTTPYIITFHNLEKEPIVVEQPAGALAGMVMDFWQRPIADLGQAGPDQGKGGKYLLTGPGQEPPQADGFYVVRSSTNNVFIGIRVLEPGEDKIKAAAERFRIYPYAGDGSPQRAARRPDGKDWSQVQPRGMKYWESLAEMLEQEPVHERDRMITAMLAPLGLEKGRRFAPNERQTKLLTEGALVGELMSMNISYAKRFENSYYRADTKWAYVIMFDPSQEKKSYSELDERADYFYEAVTSSKGMVSTTPGIGQAYLGAYKDKSDRWFDGSKTYRLTVPPNPPAKQFWSLTIYDTYDRVGIDNKTQNADLSSRDEGLRKNPDGSVDLYVGPAAPAGYEKNWLQTTPGKAWFAYFRLYGPLESYLDRSWYLPDFEATSASGGRALQ